MYSKNFFKKVLNTNLKLPIQIYSKNNVINLNINELK